MTTADALVLLMLALIPTALTMAMFLSRQSLLGFPSAMFWALLGGYSYGLSTAPWVDWPFYLFFISMFGMVIFTMYGAYGMREQTEKYIDEQGNEQKRKKSSEGGSRSSGTANANGTDSSEGEGSQPATNPNTDDDILPPPTPPRLRVVRTAKKRKGEFDW